MIEYRNDELYNSGKRDIRAVMQHEIFELYNSDILDYLLENHMAAFSSKLIKEINKLMKILLNDEEPANYENESTQETFIDNIVKSLNNYYSKDLKYVLWLADKAAVIHLYEGNENNMTAYIASPIILSDLGFDGRLYAYEDAPAPLEQQKG